MIYKKISSPVYKPSTSHEYRPIKFAVCPYVRPERMNGILRYSVQNRQEFKMLRLLSPEV